MKRVTFTKKPVIPKGWIPRPDQSAYNFLDWFTNYNDWTKYIKSSVHTSPMPKPQHLKKAS